jgi:glyoxylase-like metal-dependent hydrolase (beta-lactamase superfamily II)
MDGRQVVFRTKVGPKTKRLAERDDLELAACDYRGRIRPGTAQLAGQAGHTPGSVGVLAHTLRGWVLIAGDAAWHELQIENARRKSGYPGVLVDEDCDETFKTLQRLHLARHSVRIAPTQDHHAALRLSAPA